MAPQEITGPFLLASVPPNSLQSRLARVIVAMLVVAFANVLPFARLQLPRVDSFVPVIEGIVFVTDLVTAVLLFGQFSIARSRALLVLASGYLFTALVVVLHALSFPGAFAPQGLLGSGPQASPWLYTFWHFGFASAVVGYAYLKNGERSEIHATATRAVGWSVAIVATLACAALLAATSGEAYLPLLVADQIHFASLSKYVAGATLLVSALALGLLWVRRSSILDLWLMVVICALLAELSVNAFIITSRFSFGFYSSRAFSLVTSLVVLALLLVETTQLYARLARSNMMLRREQNNKLMSMEAIAASISHEVRQPLGAISANGEAALLSLGNVPPNLEEVRSALGAMVDDSHRASQVFDSMRALLRSTGQGHEPINVSEIALEVLRILRGELEEHGITTHADLAAGMPVVMGHKGQLHEVLLNLVHNAVEAMAALKDGSRVLRVKTGRHDRDAIIVAVEDSGPGIDPEKLDGIFDAFVTTKSHGMGLGLAICRLIIERHGGQLSARSDKKSKGAIFQFKLPIKSEAGPVAL